ncbi:MAG: hypothetical protein JW772_00560 [Candidatus Diapherotrites archaeon]|nr:hypothetical protein [Candidatus Diapherotrites archaeon]
MKAQGSLEYLLVISGAMLVSMIVITIVVASTESGGGFLGQAMLDALCSRFDKTMCGNRDPDGAGACEPNDCFWFEESRTCFGVEASERKQVCLGGISDIEVIVPVYSCTVLEQDNVTYKLMDDITIGGTCLTFAAGTSNAKLDCQGHTIHGDPGIIVLGSNNTIQNCTVIGLGGRAITVTGAGTTITNCDLDAPNETEAIFVESAGNTLNNVRVCGQSGIIKIIDSDPQYSSQPNTCSICRHSSHSAPGTSRVCTRGDEQPCPIDCG